MLDGIFGGKCSKNNGIEVKVVNEIERNASFVGSMNRDKSSDPHVTNVGLGPND